MLTVSNLVKLYGNEKALDNLSFTGKSGEIIGLIGPNGAGKSTAMNIITGYLAPTSGEVEINGFNIQANPLEARKSTGFLPETPPLYTKMTVYEYLNFAAELKGIKKDRNKCVKSVIEKLSLGEVQNKLTGTLSKGYRQRTGMAQAIINNPRLLILDEPASGLDPRQMTEMNNLILSLKSDSLIILSSHQLKEVYALCDKILLINRGKLLFSGTGSEISEGIKNKENTIELVLSGKGTSPDSIILENGFAITGKTEKTDRIRYLLTWTGNPEKKDLLISKLLEKGFSLVSLKSRDNNLEELYLKLTEEKQ